MYIRPVVIDDEIQIDALVEDIARFHNDAIKITIKITIKIKGYAGSAAERDKKTAAGKTTFEKSLRMFSIPSSAPHLKTVLRMHLPSSRIVW